MTSVPPGGSYTPPPPPPSGRTTPSSDRTLMLVLSYLGFLAFIPFFAKKDDAEVQWHAKNGVVLFGAEVIWVVIEFILMFVRIPCGASIIGCVGWLGFLALSIVAIMKAVGGQRLRIPIVTDMAEKM